MPPSAQLGGGFEERDFAESHTIPEFPRACLRPEIARRDANIVLHYTYNRQSTRVAAFVCLHTSSEHSKCSYQKETFVQSFTFANGNCIKDYGSKTLHYVGDGQGC